MKIIEVTKAKRIMEWLCHMGWLKDLDIKPESLNERATILHYFMIRLNENYPDNNDNDDFLI